MGFISDYRNTCTSTFTAPLITVARGWNQPRCLLADSWRSKMWYIFTMGYHSA